MEYKFIVKYGFGANEYVIITNKEVQKAIYAKLAKKPIILSGVMIDGDKIIYIKPDIHSYTGWYRSYEPREAEDYKQIERDLPKEIHQYLENSQNEVIRLVESKDIKSIGKKEILLLK